MNLADTLLIFVFRQISDDISLGSDIYAASRNASTIQGSYSG